MYLKFFTLKWFTFFFTHYLGHTAIIAILIENIQCNIVQIIFSAKCNIVKISFCGEIYSTFLTLTAFIDFISCTSSHIL